MTVKHERLEPLDLPPGTLRMVNGSGGTPIATYEFGNADGPCLLFVHGIMQSHLCWHKQYTDPALTADYRMVAIDLRGHGASGRDLPQPPAPDVPPGYASTDHAGDVAAVIDQLGLRTPTLICWSAGGLVIGDYLREYGTEAVEGAVFVDAACRLNPPAHEDTFIGPGFLRHGASLFDPDMTTLIDATVGFLQDCFLEQPPLRDFAWQLAYNMAVPPANRLAMVARPGERFDEEVFPSFDRPALVIHGRQDSIVLVAASEAIAAAIPGAELRVYEDCAHTPFLEHPAAFNQDLLAFLRRNGQDAPA